MIGSCHRRQKDVKISRIVFASERRERGNLVVNE